MNMVAFDTLKLARKLRDAGMPAEQAEAVAEAEAEALGEFVMAHLATKDDIAELKQEIAGVRGEVAKVRSELKQEIAEVRSELKQDIAEVRSELKQDIAEVRTEVAGLKAQIVAQGNRHIMWSIGTMIALVGLLKLVG